MSSSGSVNRSANRAQQPDTDGSDTEDMPALETDTRIGSAFAASSASGSSSSSSSASTPPPSSTFPAPALFAFQSARVRCVPDYSCCLRYALSLAPCCMAATSARPNGASAAAASELRLIPSFSWLQSRFYPLHADAATLEFLHSCDSNFFQQGWVSSWGLRVGFLKPLLRRCMAHTDVNGLLGCGQMFLTSADQIKIVLQQSIPDSIRGKVGVEWPWSVVKEASSSSSSSSSSPRLTRLLDIGAGDGHITSHVARFFDEVVATEVAPQMVKRLRARGYETVHTGDLDQGLAMGSAIVGEGFDCIALFNVIDRCAKPRTLLKQILARMRKPRAPSSAAASSAAGGAAVNSSRLILSVPLPLDPSVEVGTKWLNPDESILSNSRQCRDFESSVCALAEMLLESGFNIESVSRLPYLSQGDTRRPFYVLDSSLWVLSARQVGEPMPREESEAYRAARGANNPHNHSGHAHGSGSSGGAAAAPVDLSSEVD